MSTIVILQLRNSGPNFRAKSYKCHAVQLSDYTLVTENYNGNYQNFLTVENFFFMMSWTDQFLFFFDHVSTSIYCSLCYYYMTEIAFKY